MFELCAILYGPCLGYIHYHMAHTHIYVQYHVVHVQSYVQYHMSFPSDLPSFTFSVPVFKVIRIIQTTFHIFDKVRIRPPVSSIHLTAGTGITKHQIK